MDAEPTKDLSTFVNLRQSSQQASEQLLPDFYCEHITLAMNRERRKQALVKLLQLIRQDIDRERKSKVGLENLSKAIKQTPNFGAEDSQQSVTEKLYHVSWNLINLPSCLSRNKFLVSWPMLSIKCLMFRSVSDEVDVDLFGRGEVQVAERFGGVGQ